MATNKRTPQADTAKTETVAPVTEAAPTEISPEEAEKLALVKAEKEAKATKLAELRESLNKAKTVLFGFMDTDIFAGLADDVKSAIERLAKKAPTSSPKANTQSFLQELFPEVGFELDEFELFKATKMGRAEMRKKVFYAQAKCAVDAEKMWIRFDAKKEAWIYDAQGATCPENWTDADRPKVIKKKAVETAV